MGHVINVMGNNKIIALSVFQIQIIIYFKELGNFFSNLFLNIFLLN